MRNILLALLLAACHASPPVKAPLPVERFDERVRDDFFDGLRGDTAALDRAMKLCEDTLATNPKHAEAMVWHGAGLLGRSAVAFRASERDRGMALFTQGLAEMDTAVELEPNNVSVRIPRGAAVLAAAPFVSYEPEKRALLERGTADYEKTYALQQGSFGELSLHAREQLLYGLTDGFAELGNPERAAHYFEKMQREAKGSELLARAASRVGGEKPDGAAPCQGCHQR